MRKLPIVSALFLFCTLAAGARAESWLGDHGHYLRFGHPVWLLNEAGRDFTITVVRDVPLPPYRGPVKATLDAPDGSRLLTTTVPAGQGAYAIAVKAAGKGVYRLQTEADGVYYFLRCDLPRMVIFAGDAAAPGAPAKAWFHLMNMLERRWWFFVPEGTQRFTILVRHRSGTSGREDLALVVHSPRGQRVAAWRGSPGLDLKQGGQTELPVTVEPTMDGRFWSVDISNGDSHWHSDNELGLRGVPPYLAQAPEMWFDPATGRPAAIALPHRDPDLRADRFAHHMPNTWIGDQSYCGLVGPHRVLLDNSAGDALTVGIGTYVLSTEPWRLKLDALGPDGRRLGGLTIDQPAEKWETNEHRFEIPAGHRGLQILAGDGNHWFAWTDPALPTVLTPADAADAVTLEITGPRRWYFSVPTETRQFTVHIETLRAGDRAVVEVQAPDRLMRVVDATRDDPGEARIDVPPALRGLRWFLNTYPATGTDYADQDETVFHRPTVTARLRLSGVPFRLAPTWGQWFGADTPRPERAE